jgi:hypothetical protein
MMCSQLTYVSTVLTPTTVQLNKIQETVNNFVQGIQINNKNWINTDLMYTPTKHGGLGMVRLSDFTKAIRVSWIRRYSIECTDDHWADIIDQKLNLNINTRKEILKYGPERFNRIIKAKIPLISNFFQSYKLFKTHFPNTIISGDNSWLTQPVVYNLNFTRKQPRKKKGTHLTPTFYGLPDSNHTLKLKDFYQNL